MMSEGMQHGLSGSRGVLLLPAEQLLEPELSVEDRH